MAPTPPPLSDPAPLPTPAGPSLRDARVARVLSRTDLGREYLLTPQLAADAVAVASATGRVRLRIGVTSLSGDRVGAEEFAGLLVRSLALEPSGEPGLFHIGCGTNELTNCHLLLVLMAEDQDGHTPARPVPALQLPEPPSAVFVVCGDGGGGGPAGRDGRARWLRGRLGVMLGPSMAGRPVHAVALSEALRVLPQLCDPALGPLPDPPRQAVAAWERSGLPTLLRQEVVPALDAAPALVAGLTGRRLRAALQDIRLTCRDRAVAAGWPTDAEGYPAGPPATDPPATDPQAVRTAEDRWAQLEAFAVAPVAVRAGRRRPIPEEKP